MKIISIWHNGKDEYGNDGHCVEIELDDGAKIYVTEGHEFRPTLRAADDATLCSCEKPRFAVSNPAKCVVCGLPRHR